MLDLLQARVAVANGIADFDVQVGDDATGDSAVWVWVVIDDSPYAMLTLDDRDELRERIRGAIATPDSGLVVYVRFRPKSEQAELLSAAGSR